MRKQFVYDFRVDYHPTKKPQYRYKNVEITFSFDFYVADKYKKISLSLMYNILRNIADLTRRIFISETNFVQFPENYIVGEPEGFFMSNFHDKFDYLTIEYVDYGTDISSVNVVKSFRSSIIIPNDVFDGIFEYYYDMFVGTKRPDVSKRDRYINFMSYKLSEIVARELSGRPGRKVSR